MKTPRNIKIGGKPIGKTPEPNPPEQVPDDEWSRAEQKALNDRFSRQSIVDIFESRPPDVTRTVPDSRGTLCPRCDHPYNGQTTMCLPCLIRDSMRRAAENVTVALPGGQQAEVPAANIRNRPTICGLCETNPAVNMYSVYRNGDIGHDAIVRHMPLCDFCRDALGKHENAVIVREPLT